MKKAATLFVILWGTVNVGAQSTCEARVDAHQEATTNQRVNYCLVPGYGTEETPAPSLVVSTAQPYGISPAVSRPIRPTAHKGDFFTEDVKVTHNLVQTRQFPKWTDGRVSEQYKREYQEALESGPETANELIAQTECDAQQDGGWFEEEGEEETFTGLKARQTKPSRRWTTAAVSDSLPPVTQLDDIQTVDELATPYTYDDSYAPAVDMVSQKPQDGYSSTDDLSQQTSQEIAAGTYEYSPAQLPTGDVLSSTEEIVSQDIPVGEFSYEPAQ